jgi:starch synthase (maltosyl-transferring)
MPRQPGEGRRRVAIEHVRPEVDCGRFPVKRVVGDTVVVEAAVFGDGHDQVACQMLYWFEGSPEQTPLPMTALGNDLWRAEFKVHRLGTYRYTIEGWIDHFQTWRDDLQKRIDAGQDIQIDLLIGADFIEAASKFANGDDAKMLLDAARRLPELKAEPAGRALALDENLFGVISRYRDPTLVTRYSKELAVVVDREKAQFSAWYEVFPRSTSPEPGQHATLRDAVARLDYVASMGFDVVYLPPVHPIGETFRKGKNNSVTAQRGDVGSPWAIGSSEGGHMAVHPQLGSLADFRDFVAKAKERDLEVALDIAFQCSPDHPYAKEHPEWFRRRPDGTIQYAENPPKKYQDIYPLNFETDKWPELWTELKNVFAFWMDQGVRIFRVDNPHTKPFEFWEWTIGELKAKDPGVIFLAEAFTRPHIMYRLAKLGFTQSYTYFTWRNTKAELTEYFTELTQTEVHEFFRPNLWPNTPDILHEFLQKGGRPAFMIRLILAATLGSNYGIYGAAYELCENVPYQAGSEEYLNSEKYEIKHWDLSSPTSLQSLIARLNGIRKENRALQSNRNLFFHSTDNPSLICYSKRTDDFSNVIFAIVNLDPFNTQFGFLTLDFAALGIDASRPYEIHDLLGGGRYTWNGPRNYVELRPGIATAHIFRVLRG